MAGASITREEAREQLWRLGRLAWKLYPQDQREVYAFIRDCPARTVVVNIARQFGKSFIVLLYAIEFALQNAGVQIRFVSSSQKSLRKIIHPNMRSILEDCPADLRPQWRSDDSLYAFANGSELHMAGANDGHEDDSRGQRSHLNVVDEAGFVDRLEYLVKSVLLPQTKTTRGRTILISTPPETPAHDYVSFVARAEARGAYIVRTIEQDLHTSDVEKAEMIEELGGIESTAVRRECFCEFVVEETKAVVPEFMQGNRYKRLVSEAAPPTHETPLVAMDVGFADFHAILYGYWYFREARLVVQAEDVLQRATTDKIAAAMRATEARLWGSGRKSTKGPARWSDTDLRLIADLYEIHKLAVSPTEKDDKEAQVNALRLLVKDEKIQIDPSCVTLIRQLKTAVWKDNRREFERTKSEGHFDTVDALIYMLRNAPRHENPYPALAEGITDERHWIPAHLRGPRVSGDAAVIDSMFKGRRG